MYYDREGSRMMLWYQFSLLLFFNRKNGMKLNLSSLNEDHVHLLRLFSSVSLALELFLLELVANVAHPKFFRVLYYYRTTDCR